MKKMLAIFLSTVLVIGIFSGCTGKENTNSQSHHDATIDNETTLNGIPWNQYAYINDMSMVMWYLSKERRVVDYDDWNFYELLTNEQQYILVQNKDYHNPEYFLFGYEETDQFYSFTGYNSISVLDSFEEVYRDDVSMVYHLKFNTIWGECWEEDLYIKCNKNGLIEKLKGDDSGSCDYEMVYNELGKIRSLYYADGSGKWQTLNDFMNISIMESSVEVEYTYNLDGTLNSTRGSFGDNNQGYDFSYDENGIRLTRVSNIYSMGPQVVNYEYSKQGHLTWQIHIEENGKKETYMIEYFDDGTFTSIRQ